MPSVACISLVDLYCDHVMQCDHVMHSTTHTIKITMMILLVCFHGIFFINEDDLSNAWSRHPHHIKGSNGLTQFLSWQHGDWYITMTTTLTMTSPLLTVLLRFDITRHVPVCNPREYWLMCGGPLPPY